MFEQVLALLEKNRNLEEKIFSSPDTANQTAETISEELLIKTLSSQTNEILSNQSNDLSIMKMLLNHSDCADKKLSDQHRSALQLVEIMFNYLRTHSSFQSITYSILNGTELAFAHLAIRDISFFSDKEHPALKFLDKIIAIEHHFDNSAGKLAKAFANAILHLATQLASTQSITTQVFAKAHQKLDEFCAGLDKKVLQNTNNLKSQIEQSSKKIKAEADSKTLIHERTHADGMPLFLVDFYENHMTKVLLRILLSHGVESQQSKSFLSDLDLLTWSITSGLSGEDYKERFENDVTPMMKRIYTLLQDSNLINDYVNDFFIETESIQTKRLQGQRVTYETVSAGALLIDEDFDFSWDEEDNFQLDSLKVGKWYNVQVNESTIYCQLLIKDDFIEKLVFVNVSGEEVVTVSTKDTQFLSHNISLPLPHQYIEYDHIFNAMQQELNSKATVLETEYEVVKLKEAQNEEERRVMEELSRQAIAKKMAEEKEQQTIKQQEAIKLQFEQEAEEQRTRVIEEKQNKIYESLIPDTIIGYKNDSDKWQEATVTMYSKSKQKTIFVNNRNSDTLELSKEEIYDLIAQQKFRLLRASKGSSHDPLSSLVMQRRQKLSQG